MNSVIKPDRPYWTTFPCGSSTRQCGSCSVQQGYCPVTYDNFVPNTSIPFWTQKARDYQDIARNCRKYGDRVLYYVPVTQDINGEITLTKLFMMEQVPEIDTMRMIDENIEYVIY